MKKKQLKTNEITKKISEISGWSLNKTETQLTKTFLFPNFVTALAFCAKVAVHAEVLDHHPNLELSYGKVKIKLTTDEVKGLTKSDFELAKRIERFKL